MDKRKIVEKYTVYGVPGHLIKSMCEELNINEAKLNEYLIGQTCGVVGEESIIYVGDIMRFIEGLPVID